MRTARRALLALTMICPALGAPVADEDSSVAPDESSRSAPEQDEPTRFGITQRMLDRWNAAHSRGRGYLTEWEAGGRTKFGVTQGMLDLWNSGHPDADDWMPAEVSELDRDQARRILKEAIYDGHRLAEIEDDELARQLIDMYTTHPAKTVQAIVQTAIDSVMRGHGLYSDEEQPFSPGAPIGPRTRARLNWLVKAGYGPELRDAFVREREAIVDRYAGRFTGTGWSVRIRSVGAPPGTRE